MGIITELFGEGRDLNALQMSCRTVVMFIIALAFIRIAGIKTFGKNSAFDNIIIIMLGAILSRAVVGVSPFLPVVFSGLTMVVMTRIVSILSIHNKTFGQLVKGKSRSPLKNGIINRSNLHKSLLSENDLLEGIRKEGNTNSLEDIEEAFVERTGKISVIKKKK
ncbi:MAG: YetF domain-containing protein [Segetibacter sp.]